MLVHYIHLLVFRIVKVLSGLVQHMNFVDVIHIDLILHILSKLNILIEASSSRPSPRIRRSLPLSLDALNDLSGFRINPSKRIHALAVLRQYVAPRSPLCWSPIW